ncbi:MAG: hypothetical protein Q6373_000465 [Candidatus Sigynarchaeota archaeon]
MESKRTVKPKNLLDRPRIEMIPAILNIPLVAIILVLIFGYPAYWNNINEEANRLFGANGIDFVIVITSISTCAGVYCIGYILLVLMRPRVAHAPLLNIIPLLTGISLEGCCIIVLSGNDYLSFYEIHYLLGDVLSPLLYLAIIFIIVALCLLLLQGIPALWNLAEERGTEAKEGAVGTRWRYRPRFTSITTIAGFCACVPLFFLFLIDNPRMIFWKALVYRFSWLEALPITHVIASTSFIVVIITAAAITVLSQRARREPVPRWFHVDSKLIRVLLVASLVVQAISLMFMGVTSGDRVMALHPLTTITMGEGLILFAIILKKALISRRSKGTWARRHETVLLILIVLIPLSWVFFCQPLVQDPPYPRLASVPVVAVKNSYANLTATQKTLFDEYMNYDFPPGTQAASILTSSASTRDRVRLASAFLFRNATGDTGNASVILEWLMPLQYTDVSSNSYGAWKTSPGSSTVDENWREFIGCELILILDQHSGKLSPDLVSKIKQSLIRAAEGAKNRNVRPSYTNIAFMSAFLMEYVGASMHRQDLENAGTMKSWECYLLFQEHGTFTEFNSPTYSGVDMLALALWRDLGKTQSMRTMGAEMEAALWRHVASYYHAGLRNLAGPYFRAYGMDMTRYNAIIGIWIALATENLATAPLPRAAGASFFELSNVFPAVQVGHAVPDGVLQDLNTFTGSRFMQKTVPCDPSYFSARYHVSTLVGEDWIMGGVTGRHYEKNQFKAGTIQWNASNPGSIASLVVLGLGTQEVVVTETSMTIQRFDSKKGIEFCVNCNGINAERFNGTTWVLPGIGFTITGDPAAITASVMSSAAYKSEYSIAEGVYTVVKVTCNLNSITLVPFLP